MYLRKSQMDRDFDEISVEETLKRHEKTLTEFCEKNNLKVDITMKEVVSGESLSERRQMMRLLELVSTGEYAGVVCMDIDRLSRGSGMDSSYIMSVLQASDCKIITPSKTYNLNNETDEQFADMKFMFSRFEHKTITKRLVRGRNDSAKEGKFMGSVAPYGYEIVKLKGEKGNTLKIKPDEAEVVRMIFKWYTEEQMGYHAIAHKLDELHVPAMISEQWSWKSIANIINNPVYVGKMAWGRSKQKKTFVDGKLVKKRSINNNHEVYEGLQEPIIDEDTWGRCVTVRSGRYNPPVKADKELTNPLATLVMCGKCGRTLAKNVPAKNHNTSPWYHCRNRCGGRTIKCDIVEEAVLKEMKSWLHNYIIQIVADIPKNDNKYQTALEMVQNKIKELIEQQDNLCELLEKKTYSLDLFNRRNAVIESELAQLKLDEADLLSKIENQSQKETQAVNFIPSAQRLLDNYDNLSVKEKNMLWKEVLEKVTVFRSKSDEISIQIYPRLPQ
jgi:DNA invertase Pin-like site-specific DNA recombinase